MKIEINKIKVTPEKFGFNFCVYGELSEEIKQWANHWNLQIQEFGKYKNIILNEDTNISDLFYDNNTYEYMDGFSPNLCKKLHLGHLSNLIIAKSLQKLGVSKKFVSILGDTVGGDIDKLESLEYFKSICNKFDYKVDDILFASEVKLKDDTLLLCGTGEYSDTKIFDIEGEKIVGIKSTGMTTYFYQDVSLAQKLNSPTLYLTGQEQENHFKTLKKIFPHINHIPLGLVLYNGKKMSTSEGNVIFLEDLFTQLKEIFDNDELVYNILACQILKSTPDGSKSINTEVVSNPKLSPGLYLSYTMAHIKSCGVNTKDITDFNSKELSFSYLKSKSMLQPNILLEGLVNHCKKINGLYAKLYIKDNPENIELFSNLISDLELGMKKIGLFSVDKV